MLEHICHLRLAHPDWEGQKTYFINTMKNIFVRGATKSLKSSVIALLCRSDLTVVIEATQLRILNAIGVIVF